MYGLGGRDIKVEDFWKVFDELEEVVETGNNPSGYRYIGLRE